MDNNDRWMHAKLCLEVARFPPTAIQSNEKRFCIATVYLAF